MTGGTRGAGKAAARALYAAGARLVLCGRSARALVAAAKEIGEIICIPGDAAQAIRKLDRLDALVPGGAGKGRAAGHAARALLRRSGGRVFHARGPVERLVASVARATRRR